MGFNEFKELWGALNQWKVSTELKLFKSIKSKTLFNFEFVDSKIANISEENKSIK